MADGLARSGFDKDLAFGEARESAFVLALRDAHVECKSDQKCRATGNVAIEIRQGSMEPGKGKPSGLAVTTARWWSIEYADDCWLVIRTSLLKSVTTGVYRDRGSVMGGDGNRFEIVLVPVEKLIRPLVALRDEPAPAQLLTLSSKNADWVREYETASIDGSRELGA